MPISGRKYQLAVGLPGQLNSYQDYTHFKGNLDECLNATDGFLPYGRFVAEDADGLRGDLVLPSTTDTNVVGVIPQQGFFERNPLTGEVGIPAKRPFSYMYKGVIFMECIGNVALGDALVIAADENDAANQGKVVVTYANNSVAIPGNYRVVRASSGGLVQLELDLPSTLLNKA